MNLHSYVWNQFPGSFVVKRQNIWPQNVTTDQSESSIPDMHNKQHYEIKISPWVRQLSDDTEDWLIRSAAV